MTSSNILNIDDMINDKNNFDGQRIAKIDY